MSWTPALAGARDGFDVEHVAAERRPGEPLHDARQPLLAPLVGAELRPAEQGLQFSEAAPAMASGRSDGRRRGARDRGAVTCSPP